MSGGIPLLNIITYDTRIPGLVREHRADKANDDIRNSARTKGCVLKTRRIPRTLSALLLVEQSIQGFYWIFATLAHAQNKSWCSRTNPDTRVLALSPHSLLPCSPLASGWLLNSHDAHGVPLVGGARMKLASPPGGIGGS